MPVDLVDDVDALFVRAGVEADVLREMRFSEAPFHLQRGHDRAVLGHGDPHVAVHGHRGAVHGLFRDFPGRPLEGLVLREHRQPDGLSFRDELPAVALVDQGADVAVGIQAQAVHGVLKGGSARFQARPGGGRVALAEIVHRVSDGRDFGHEGQLAVRQALRADHPALGVEDPAFGGIDGHDFPARDAGGVVEHERRARNPGVQTGCHRAHGGFQHVGELPQRDHFVVPGELVGPRDARAGEVVVELVPEETAPGLVQAGLRVGDPAQPVGGRGAALGRVRELLVQPVEALHRGLRGVTAGTMDIHRQFLVPHREFRVAVVRQEILEQLVGRGADHMDGAFLPGPLPVDRSLDRRDRFEGGGAARVTGAVIVVGDVVGVEGRVLRQLFVVRQVLRVEAGAVAQGVGGHHDLVAV